MLTWCEKASPGTFDTEKEKAPESGVSALIPTVSNTSSLKVSLSEWCQHFQLLRFCQLVSIY